MNIKITIPLLILLIFIILVTLIESLNHDDFDQPEKSETIIILGAEIRDV